MEKLRSRFAKTEHASQLKDYDAQIGKLKSAISEYEHDLEYMENILPTEVKRQEFKRIDDVLNTEIAALDVHARPVRIAKAGRTAGAAAIPKKTTKYDMVFTLKDIEENKEKGKKSLSPGKPTEVGMVFTQEELDELEKKTGQATRQAGKQERRDALRKARRFGKEMARLRKEGKPTGAAARRRYDAFSEYVALDGDLEKVPTNVVKQLLKEGKLL
jgi:TolA-binding protein